MLVLSRISLLSSENQHPFEAFHDDVRLDDGNQTFILTYQGLGEEMEYSFGAQSARTKSVKTMELIETMEPNIGKGKKLKEFVSSIVLLRAGQYNLVQRDCTCRKKVFGWKFLCKQKALGGCGMISAQN